MSAWGWAVSGGSPREGQSLVESPECKALNAGMPREMRALPPVEGQWGPRRPREGALERDSCTLRETPQAGVRAHPNTSPAIANTLGSL